MTDVTVPAITDRSASWLRRTCLRLGRWVLAAALLAAAGFTARPAVAQETLDQSNAPANWRGGANQIMDRTEQTISPKLRCLTRVDIGLMTGNRGRGGEQVTLTVLDWDAWYVGKHTELAKVTVDVQEGFDGFLTFSMPGGGIPVPRQWVALRVQGGPQNVFFWKYEPGNPYPGGLRFVGGYGGYENDYLFKTYGRERCSFFALSVTPNPVTLVQGGSSSATVGVTREVGFTGVVDVTLKLPGGVTSAPTKISGATETTTLSATAGAPTGTFAATATGTATGAPPAQTSFNVRVTTASVTGPKVTSVAPSVQQKGGTITVKGSGFDANCSSNTVTVASVDVPATSCKAGEITATVPPEAAYGKTRLKVVKSGGGASNEVDFRVAREAGMFVEITKDVLFDHTSHTCASGTARVEVADNVASYLRVPGNTLISRFKFQPDLWYWQDAEKRTKYTVAGIGGAGFSLCTVALVFDSGDDGSSPRLFLNDLDLKVDFQASPHTVPIEVPRLTPPWTQTYLPRLFRSPDGTLILVITAAPLSGTGNYVATFFDKVANGAILKSVPITTPGRSPVGNPAISVTLTTDNQVKLVFGGQIPGDFSIP